MRNISTFCTKVKPKEPIFVPANEEIEREKTNLAIAIAVPCCVVLVVVGVVVGVVMYRKKKTKPTKTPEEDTDRRCSK